MRYKYLCPLLLLITTGIPVLVPFGQAREFLTDKEIERIQDAQRIDERVKIYMEAAELRLKTAEERLMGKEPTEGDPLEFFSPEDLLDAYYRILKSVMFNLDDAAQTPGNDLSYVKGALKTLKKTTENAAKELGVLKRIAEEQKKENLWNLVNKAMDITDGSHEGAEYGLSKESESSDENRKRK
jgi:hypothetical protein